MRAPTVLVLYNEPTLPIGHPDYISEHEILENVEAVSAALDNAAYRVQRLGVCDNPDELLAGLREPRPDVVFNLFEGAGDFSITECYVAGLLDWLHLPFTGCPFQTLVFARNKHLTKHLFRSEGLPTAPFLVVEELPVLSCPLSWPVICKPAQQDASIGVEQSCVVTDLDALNARARRMAHEFGFPILVEEFIFGREMTAALVEMPHLRMLPITEALFPPETQGYWPILSYDAKWNIDSHEYNATDYCFGAEIPAVLAEQLETLARKAFRILGARDYARVDFRIRRDTEPFLLELNPNPNFSPGKALANNLCAAGISHEEFTVQLVRNALARGSPSPTARYQIQVNGGVKAPLVMP